MRFSILEPTLNFRNRKTGDAPDPLSEHSQDGELLFDGLSGFWTHPQLFRTVPQRNHLAGEELGIADQVEIIQILDRIATANLVGAQDALASGRLAKIPHNHQRPA
jgi:hypothetical protein